MSMIQSRTPEKKAKNPCNIDLKISMKILFHFSRHLPFLSSNSKILNAFLKTFSTKIKPTKCRAKEKNEARKAKKEGRSEKAESKS